MNKLVALSAIGSDRPGIVAALAQVLYETGCNLEDSSMTRLKGNFAILLLVSLPEKANFDHLSQTIKKTAEKLGLTLSIRELSASEASIQPGASLPYTLVVYGVDHPGIVYQVAQKLSALSINITDLRTHMTQSKGNPLYSMIMEIEISSQSAAGELKKEMESLARELRVEMTLNPVEVDEL